MAKTKLLVGMFIPSTSLARMSDLTTDLSAVLEKHKASGVFTQVSGPWPDDAVLGVRNADFDSFRADGGAPHGAGGAGGAGSSQRGGSVGRRSAQADAAAADFAEADGEDGAGPDAGADASGDAAGSADGKPRRGRPRGSGRKPADGGSAEAPGTAAAGSERPRRSRRNAASGDAPEADRGNEPVGTHEGTRQGGGGCEGGQRGAGANRGNQRGDASPARVASASDWDAPPAAAPAAPTTGRPDPHDIYTEEGPEFWSKLPDEAGWPDHLTPENIETQDLAQMCVDLFNVNGGNRTEVDEIVNDIAGTTKLSEVSGDDYDDLARELLRETAKYTYGIIRPKSKK